MPRFSPFLLFVNPLAKTTYKTERELKALSKAPGEYYVGGVPGLMLRVREGKTGLSCYWVLKSALTGKKRYSLGASYPETGLKAARELGRLACEQIKQNGLTPMTVERLARKKADEEREQAAASTLTMGTLLDEWMNWKAENGDIKNPTEWKRREGNRIKKNLVNLFPLNAATIEPEEIADALRPIWCEKRETADRVAGHLRGFFDWCMIVRGARPRGLNPANGRFLRPLLPAESRRKTEGHRPALSPAMVPEYFEALNRMGGQAARMIALAVLTCVRSANIRGMRWCQLNNDLTLWEIPAEEMKVTANGQHLIPLNDAAREILKAQKAETVWPLSDYVFPNPNDASRILTAEALEKAVKKVHDLALQADGVGFIDERQTKEQADLVAATLHGFRATFETWAYETRQDERAAELVLAHQVDKSGLKSAYGRDHSMPYKIQVLENWAAHCFSKIKHWEK